MNAHYLYVFFQSNGLEVLFILLFHKSIFKRALFNRTKTAIIVTLINSITHPVVIFLILRMQLSYLNGILIAEGFAIFVESIFYCRIFKISYSRALTVSALANVISWQLGPMLTAYFFLQDKMT